MGGEVEGRVTGGRKGGRRGSSGGGDGRYTVNLVLPYNYVPVIVKIAAVLNGGSGSSRLNHREGRLGVFFLGIPLSTPGRERIRKGKEEVGDRQKRLNRLAG